MTAHTRPPRRNELFLNILGIICLLPLPLPQFWHLDLQLKLGVLKTAKTAAQCCNPMCHHVSDFAKAIQAIHTPKISKDLQSQVVSHGVSEESMITGSKPMPCLFAAELWPGGTRWANMGKQQSRSRMNEVDSEHNRG